MLLRKSAYYDEFVCLADRCPDSCCREWDVLVDPESASRYRSLPGPLGDRLRQVLAEDADGDTFMAIENGRCPMWRADGLCRIQAELGHDALCKTCREFPRLTHDYGDFVELGLELSCPEAARLILTSPVRPPVCQKIPGGETPEYDTGAMEILLRTRQTVLELLQDAAYSVPEALALLLMYGHHTQALLDGEPELSFDPKAALTEARRFAGPAASSLPEFFAGLEILTQEWKLLLTQPHSPVGWSDMLRNLACCGVERYWLQSVSDYDLVCRVKLVVASCLLVRLLGGDTLRTAQLYSKEIENDADNIDAILDAAWSHTALTDAALLGQLLKEDSHDFL